MKHSSIIRNLIFAFVSLGSAFLLTSCGESAEDRQIAAGLACLDEARNAADADLCLAKVEGLESQQSYLIRCSANFIAQGFTGSRVASAFQQQSEDQGAGNTQTAAMISYFVFNNALTSHTADVTLANCQKSGVQSMVGLASLAQTATLIANFGGGALSDALNPSSGTFDPAALQAQIDALVALDPATSPEAAAAFESIGQLATTAQSVYCGSGSGFDTQDVCTKLDAAVAAGGGDLSDIGYSLLNQLQAQ